VARWWSASTIGPLLVAGAASVVAAAPPVGEVTGVVKDAFERPLAAARVRLETGDGRVTDRVTADDQGRFTFTGVAPGRYTVVAEGEGLAVPAEAGALGLAVAPGFAAPAEAVAVGLAVPAEAVALGLAVAPGVAPVAVSVGEGVRHSSAGAVVPVRSRFLTIRCAS